MTFRIEILAQEQEHFFYSQNLKLKILIFELKLMAETKDKKTEVPPVNFLCDEGKVPEKKSDEFYDF